MRQAEKVDLGSDDWTMEIRPYASAFHFPIKELWEYRDLLFLFVRRDFKTMYKQTILGPAWILLSPLLTTGMFSLIFGRIAGISTDGTPAFLFYMAGNILWNYFSSCLSAASSTFIGNAGLWCATRQVDKLNNENFSSPVQFMYRVVYATFSSFCS